MITQMIQMIYVTEDFLPDDPDDTDEEGVYITDDTMLAMIDEEEEADLQYSRKPSNYPNNVLTDENSIQPTSIENSNMSAPRIAPPDHYGTELENQLELRLPKYLIEKMEKDLLK
jgi:hypothetical protein